MDILDDMEVIKLSVKVFLKKWTTPLNWCSGFLYWSKMWPLIH